MQDGCRILGSGKSGKMAKKYQHHKFPSCLGNPSMRERTRRILYTFSDITKFLHLCFKTMHELNTLTEQILEEFLFDISSVS